MSTFNSLVRIDLKTSGGGNGEGTDVREVKRSDFCKRSNKRGIDIEEVVKSEFCRGGVRQFVKSDFWIPSTLLLLYY